MSPKENPADGKKTDPDSPPDLDRLARDYMDLWQKHLAGLAGDEAVADLMARTATLMNAGLMNTNVMDPATNPFLSPFAAASGSKAPDHETTARPTAAHAPRPHAGTKAAAAADGDPDDDVGELRRRLAALEKRIAELEAGAKPKRKRPAKKTAKR